ncbi:DUF551 domain-containing protein, partial [Escherichia coli]|nr:DUF551 domain-containing protein [Escherichia coli]
MITITKERLLTIKQWRETYGPGSNVVLPAEEAEELARIALASLEAEPVAYIFKHPAGKLFWALTDESNKEQADVIPVYAAAPASVVPDNASEPLAYAYKELTPEIMRNHLAVFERYGIAPNDSSTTIHALRIALDGIERSDAMLHGAEPVSQTYKLPVNTPCKDAPAHIWLQTAGVWPEDGELSELTWCSHNQHHDDTLYVRADLVNGNSPVTPDSWISCSKRMPDTKTAVLVAVEFDRKGDWRMKWATYIPGHPDANDGWIIPGASWKPS